MADSTVRILLASLFIAALIVAGLWLRKKSLEWEPLDEQEEYDLRQW